MAKAELISKIKVSSLVSTKDSLHSASQEDLHKKNK
jgi:hypothetical protein